MILGSGLATNQSSTSSEQPRLEKVASRDRPETQQSDTRVERDERNRDRHRSKEGKGNDDKYDYKRAGDRRSPSRRDKRSNSRQRDAQRYRDQIKDKGEERYRDKGRDRDYDRQRGRSRSKERYDRESDRDRRDRDRRSRSREKQYKSGAKRKESPEQKKKPANEGKRDVDYFLENKDQSDKTPTVVSTQQQKQARSDVRVREIWLGNLPESITKETLYSHFFICGEIEDIELQRHNKSYPYYAFVRFKLSSCAKRAFDMGQSLEIDGMKLKVQFSDYNKRPTQIVGDLPDYDLTQSNCSTLFIAFSVNSQLPTQQKIEDMFKQYGKVRAIWMKQTEANTKYRPHFFVDYRTPQEAQKAKFDMYDSDKYGLKRQELGDKSSEIKFATHKRNNKETQSGFQQQSATQFQQSHTKFQNTQFNAPIQQISQPNPPQTNTLPNPKIQQIQQLPIFKAMQIQNPEVANQLLQEIQTNPNSEINEVFAKFIQRLKSVNTQVSTNNQIVPPQQSPIPTAHPCSTSILDFIKNKKQLQTSEVPESPKIAPKDQQHQQLRSFFEDEDRNLWSGFVTRNKQHRVLMEAYVVGDIHTPGSKVIDNIQPFLSDQEHNLNVSHRTNFEDVDRYPVQGVVALIPANETQERQFNEYIEYFQQKQRVGLCFLRNGVMFLLPPGDMSRKFFQCERPNHMVGVFGDAQAAAAQSARFSGQGNNNNK